MPTNDRQYWLLAADPHRYRLLTAIQELPIDTWSTGRSKLEVGDRAFIWQMKGNGDHRGIVALAEIQSEPAPRNDAGNAYWIDRERQQAVMDRVDVRYYQSPGLPLWLEDDHMGLLQDLSVVNAHGGSVFKVTPEQWDRILTAVGGWPSGNRQFGEVPNVAVGTTFRSRAELATSGIHRPLQAGISGSQEEGADSIVLSGGYEDDIDEGDLIIYTGHGGNDPTSRKQIADQKLERGNKALARNCLEGLPVRVVRGAEHKSPFSPATGYRYDGLFFVDEYWSERGRSGYLIWRFRLVRDPTGKPAQSASPPAVGTNLPSRQTTTIQRIVRSTQVVTWVKEIHQHHCQVCGERLDTPAGPYSEGAHIRPLGQPHNGPDVIENVLCLCPNHHVLLDQGAIAITDAYEIIDLLSKTIVASLRVRPEHQIGQEFLSYQRGLYRA